MKDETRESLQTAMAFLPHDLGEHHRVAWIYGIVMGWDAESLREQAMKHGWDKPTVARLERLRKDFQGVKEKPTIISAGSKVNLFYRIRKRLGLTQEEVGKRIGMSTSGVQHIEARDTASVNQIIALVGEESMTVTFCQGETILED